MLSLRSSPTTRPAGPTCAAISAANKPGPEPVPWSLLPAASYFVHTLLGR
jgi:hypothetical protein